MYSRAPLERTHFKGMPASKAYNLLSHERFHSYFHIGNKAASQKDMILFVQPLDMRSSEAQLYRVKVKCHKLSFKSYVTDWC